MFSKDNIYKLRYTLQNIIKGKTTMRIEELKKLYKNEWVLVEVLEVNEIGEPVEVNLIAHSKDRDETYAELKKTKIKHVSHFYTGKIPKEGYAVAFKWAN